MDQPESSVQTLTEGAPNYGHTCENAVDFPCSSRPNYMKGIPYQASIVKPSKLEKEVYVENHESCTAVTLVHVLIVFFLALLMTFSSKRL